MAKEVVGQHQNVSQFCSASCHVKIPLNVSSFIVYCASSVEPVPIVIGFTQSHIARRAFKWSDFATS